MIYCNLIGGLGNQLFQIYTTISYALRENQEYHIFSLNRINIKRPVYWDNFFSEIKNYNGFCNLINKTINEPNFHYNELPKLDNTNNLLIGYFQSNKYFEKYENEITNMLKIEEKKEKLIESYNNLTKNKKTISLHFRLGDYLFLQNSHPILPYSYYYNSLKYLLDNINSEEKINVLYFCEEENINIVKKHIENLKNDFSHLTFICCPHHIPDWQQMLLMSLCDYNIIANSTFSWWGAYLNKKNNIVCYPNIWFGENLIHNNTKDLFPLNWIKINC